MAAWKLEWSRQYVRRVLMMMCLSIVVVTGINGNSTAVNPATSMIDDMDSTTASPQNTAPGVTQGQQATSPRDCFLSITSDEKQDVDDMINKAFQDNAVFIYLKLNFANLSDIYDNSSNVIDPSMWVWAVQGKGELLLSYPFDFEQLSLGTLALGVVTVEVPVSTPSDVCFQEAADDDKQRIIARFVGSLVQSANDTLNITNNEFYANKGSVVCLEKQRSDDFEPLIVRLHNIPLYTYYALQASTLYECWAGDQNPFETESTLVEKHGWLGAIFALGFLLALFSPLAASFFIRKQEPIKKDGKEYIALNADLPYGFKYLLCFSFQDYRAIFVIRGVVYAFAVMIIPFIPYIVSYVMRGDAFCRRFVAFEILLGRTVIIFWFVFVNIMFLTTAILFIWFCWRDELVVNPADRIYLPLDVKLPKELHVPENPIPSNSALRTFIYTMWYRTQMAVNPAFWSFLISKVWSGIHYCLGCCKDEENKNRCCLHVTFIVCVTLFPFSLVFVSFYILLFNSVPLIYMTHWIPAKVSDSEYCSLFAPIIAMFFSTQATFVFVAAFVYIAELIGYTFIGFVLNTEFVTPLAIIIITVVGYLITAATAFYDKYCVLLKRTIETAEQLDKELDEELEKESKKKKSEMVPAEAHARSASEFDADHNDGAAIDQESIALQPMVEQTAQPNRRKLVEFQKGIPFIPRDLFALVITKYQPIYLEVATIALKLIIIGVVVAFGLTTITSIDRVSGLPATVRLFATVVVAGVVPLLMLILQSRSEQENDDKLKTRSLEAIIKQYAELTNQPTNQPNERTPGDETSVPILNSDSKDTSL